MRRHGPSHLSLQYYLDRFPSVKDERRRIYMAMVSALDDGVGAILKKLRDTHLEGGFRVPFAMQWPAQATFEVDGVKLNVCDVNLVGRTLFEITHESDA